MAIITIAFMLSCCILLALYLVREQGKIELQDSIQPMSDMCIDCGHIECTCVPDCMSHINHCFSCHEDLKHCTCEADYEEMQADVHINLQKDQNQHID